jgi:nucleotide-binding universal stress UspA family protein
MAGRDPERITAPRRILVSVDTDAGLAAVDQAASLAAGLDAELVVLGITPESLQIAPVPSALAFGSESVVDDDEVIEGPARRRVREARERLPRGVRCRMIFHAAPAGPAIVKTARELSVHLVVVPMRRGGRLTHLVRDGTHRHVLHESPVPVLVVPVA